MKVALLLLAALIAVDFLIQLRRRKARRKYAENPNAEFRHCPLCSEFLRATDIGGKTHLACPACGFVHWDNPKPVTITLVPMDGGLVLVLRKLNPGAGKWALPGGFMEGYEAPAIGAAREVLEETKLKVEIDRVLGAFPARPGINQIVLVFLAKPSSGTPLAGDDALEARVFRKEDLGSIEIAFPLHKRAIEMYFEGAFDSVK